MKALSSLRLHFFLKSLKILARPKVSFPVCQLVALAGIILNVFLMAVPSYAQQECPCTTGQVTTYPNVQNFESQSICVLDGASCASLSCSISGDWTNITGNGDDLDWTIRQGGTPTSNTGPSSGYPSSGKYIYLESSCPDIGHPEKEAILYSKCFNFSSIQAPELEFFYHMFGEEMGDLNVEISTDSCLTWTPLTTISGPQQSSSTQAWRSQVVNLIPYSGLQGVRLRFRAVSGGDQFSDLAIDNITVREASCCDVSVKSLIGPVNACGLGSSVPITVQLQNLGFSSQSDFNVSYQIDGGAIVTEQFPGVITGGSTANFTFATRANLSAPGEHTITVFTGLFGDTRPGNDLLATQVVNIPIITTYPYSQNFETGRGGWIANGVHSTWDFGTPNKSVIQGAFSGVNAWVTGGLGSSPYRNSEASQVVGPCFDFSSLIFPVFGMRAWWNSEGGWDGTVLQSSVNNGTSWVRVGNVGDQTNWYNDSAIDGLPGGQTVGWSGRAADTPPGGSGSWLPTSHRLNGLAGASSVRLRVAFGSDPVIRDDGFAFDDVTVQEGVSVLKNDFIEIDQNGNGLAEEGDRIRYTVVITNLSGASISGSIFEDYPGLNTALLTSPPSVTTTQGTVTQGNGPTHTFVRVNIGTIAAGATVQITFKVNVLAPLPGSGSFICNQGNLISNLFSGFPTDDPAEPGPHDPTCTASAEDSDGDGVIDPLDGCPFDPYKTEPGICGCGVPDIDSDGDGTADCNDGCPADPNKTNPGACGCGFPESDGDGDGTPDCVDGCPSDPAKTTPGACGCGVPETDSDGDGTPNCIDGCPNDSAKIAPGVCGCGIPDTDGDNDGTPDCDDGCPNDPNKISPGICGCGVSDVDSDNDGTPDCLDLCPSDPAKVAPGVCGCGVAETDSDGDGTPDCNDGCDQDPNKIAPGACGCGVPDVDFDENGTPDCLECPDPFLDSDNDGTPDCFDGCPTDPNKTSAGACGCFVPETDGDGDGVPDCIDLCPSDPNKVAPGFCGCGNPETDSDGDGTPNCIDQCPNDPNKIVPGACGCGVPDTDGDGDGVPNCNDGCPFDPLKTQPGVCGCGTPDTDSDGDGTPNCIDNCPNDPNKIQPGICGCGVADTDSDGDGTPNCIDLCPSDPLKVAPGVCGCGTPDTDSDGDGTPNCVDQCPNDPLKTVPGVCGCGVPDVDGDGDGVLNCLDQCPTDPQKIAPGVCGCGVPDSDGDGDGTPNCTDGCPADPAKTAPGFCGCGELETDSDGDSVPNCVDLCPSDPSKADPGACGCGVADDDTDGDGTLDCQESCPADPLKTAPGVCGCGSPDVDSDGDLIPDCEDGCPSDGSKTTPLVCGCGVSEVDSDGDGAKDCIDQCPADPSKFEAGICGCGNSDVDSDGDSVLNCLDQCPNDAAKQSPGLCGCGISDADGNGNGIIDCLFQDDIRAQVNLLQGKISKLKFRKGAKARAQAAAITPLLSQLDQFTLLFGQQISVSGTDRTISDLAGSVTRLSSDALNAKKKRFKRSKKLAVVSLVLLSRAVN